MSQYAFIPLQNGNQFQYLITWQFKKGEVDYIGIETPVFSLDQREEIESLGGEWFTSAEAFATWMSNSVDPIRQKKNDVNFGVSILLEFLTMQKDVQLDNATYRAISETFKYAEVALRRGDVPQAKTELTNIPLTPPVWTQQAKDYFISKIDQYLGE